MNENEMKRRIYTQLALDYCCSPEEVENCRNQFHVYIPLEGRRRFEEKGDPFLKIMSFRNKLLFTGNEEIVEWCRCRFENTEGAWFMEAGNMRELDRKLFKYGYCIDMFHPFFVPSAECLRDASLAKSSPITSGEGYEIRFYRENEIEVFRGDKRFRHAYSFCETAPDVIGAAVYHDGNILGMAGASADSDMFWQIGIDILPEARGCGFGRILVGLVRDEVLYCDRVPYYGTAVSHILSQNIAIGCGFRAVWTELTTRKAD